MCLLIASPKGNPLSDSAIIEAWQNNPDGFGIVYSDHGRLVIKKTRRLKAVFALIELASGHPFVAHFRWATHGVKNIHNCHPFEVSRDLAMAHNGIINIKRHDPLKSDSWHYAERLKPFTDSVLTEASQKIIANEIGIANKLAFLHSSGLVKIVNEKQGTWDDAIWYSNTYSVADSVFSRYRHFNLTPDTCNSADTELWEFCELCGQEDWITEHFDVNVCPTCKNLYGAEIEEEFFEENGLELEETPEIECGHSAYLKNWSDYEPE